MNRVTDMVIVGTTIMYAALALFFVLTGIALPIGILLGAFCFSLLEISVHTYFGIFCEIL